MSAQSWQTTLKDLGILCRDEPMSRHTTLGVGGPARWYFRPSGHEALITAIPMIPPDVPILPLGRGSNLLFADEGFPGLVLDLGSLSAVRIHQQEVHAEAGVRMSKMAQLCADAGLSGVEFMATVPGDIGGGIAMNAGAFGQQVSDTLREVELVHRDGRTGVRSITQLAMGYRRCQLPPGSIVTRGYFRLPTDQPEEIRQRMRSMRKRRTITQPLAHPNCGSVFKNPPEHHAAALIEKAGLKGMGIGKARFSDKHANFIINEGGATCADILRLIHKAQERVEQRFGIHLEPEVRIVGGQP
jgi:UDP-N-acetylmuramate dehydrogenase